MDGIQGNQLQFVNTDEEDRIKLGVERLVEGNTFHKARERRNVEF